MLTPDDPRHGTNAGYIAGCRCEPCGTASFRYTKQLKYDKAHGIARTVPAWRGLRRLQALQALGWSRQAVAEKLGMHKAQVYALDANTHMFRSTFDALDKVYRELAMTPPPTDTPRQRGGVQKTKNHAQRKGYAPPLAWDDIDDQRERPKRVVHAPRGGRILDPIAVERLLAGDTVRSTSEERAEAMRRWIANGGSERSFCAMHGWKEGRYKVDANA